MDFYLKILGGIISVVALSKGIYEYTKAQKWKKAEFVSKEIKEFLSDFQVKRALILLDWNSNEVPLGPNEIEGEKTKLYFTDELIYSSLQTHKEVTSFKNEEVIIKSIFDSFLEKLTMFDIYIETGLITTKDIKPYLVYWMDILCNQKNDRKPEKVQNQIWHFIDTYQYTNIRNLAKRFNYSPPKG